MLKKVLFVAATLFAFTASADPMRAGFAEILGRPLTIEENQNVDQIQAFVFKAQAQAEQPQLILANAEVNADPRNTEIWMGCLTAKGGLVLVATQQMACAGTDGMYTITKNVALGDAGTLTLNAEAGVVGVRLAVTPDANQRLQNLEILNEPVDAIGIDAAYVFGAQAVFFSSKNVSMQMIGLVVGGGGGLILEQNGAVPRESFEGSTLNIKKFNLF